MHNVAPRAWIGIDVAKRTLDVCLHPEGSKPLSRQFDNSAAGFAKLLLWVQGHTPEAVCHFCMEATGTYGQALAFFLAETGQKVSVVNPFRTKHAALSRGVGNKTDPEMA